MSLPTGLMQAPLVDPLEAPLVDPLEAPFFDPAFTTSQSPSTHALMPLGSDPVDALWGGCEDLRCLDPVVAEQAEGAMSSGDDGEAEVWRRFSTSSMAT